jgi:chromosome segregation ATPase
MATLPAELTTRPGEEGTLEAGLHAESEQGPIDVGLSLEAEALGVVVEAPGVGRLKVAFELNDDGQARLVLASRRLADGRDLAVVIDETRTTRLEGQLLGLEAELAHLATERDEALARASALAEHQVALEGRSAAAEGAWQDERRELLGRLEAERDQRLLAVGEREKARAELERAREEVDAGSATLMRELAGARAGRDVAEVERSRLSGELAEASTRLQALGQEHEGVLRGRSELEEHLLTAQAEAEQQVDAARALELELQASRERVGALEAERAAAEAALAEQAARTSQELAGLRAELDAGRASLGEVEAGRDAAVARELARTAERDDLASGRKELEGRLKALELSESTLKRRLEALGTAQRGAGAAQSEQQRLLDEARAQAQRAQAALGEEQLATTEAREVARHLKVQLDRLAQERDEARSIARSLHAKAGSASGLESELAQLKAATAGDRQRLTMQIENLGRQLDQERSARAKVLAELDDFKRRFVGQRPPDPGQTLGEPEDTRPFRIPKGLLEAAQSTNPGAPAPTARKKKP